VSKAAQPGTTDLDPGRDALVYDPSRVSWAVAESVSMPPASLARWSAYLTVLALVVAVVYSHLTSISITVDGMGIIRTSAKVIPVRNEVSGRVAAFSVKEGDAVKKGQILVELEDQVRPDTLEEARGIIKRLDALVGSKLLDTPAAIQQAGTLAQEPMRLNIPSMVHERSSLADAVNSLYQAMRAESEVPSLSIADESEMAAASAKIAKIRSQGLAHDLANELADLERTVTQKSAAIRSRREQAVEQVSSARGALEVQIRSFEQSLEVHMKTQRVVAPIDGIASKVAVTGPSELLSTGTTLLEIIPDGSSLIADVSIANRDISELKVGMPVSLRIDAMPYQDYGALPAHIVEIPPDATTDKQTNLSSYMIRCALDKTTLDSPTKQRTVRLGMTLTAQILIRKKTLLQLGISEVFKLKS
jgi:multidrug efflux pump subunit AcrA (membrane-fusion protein)